MRVYEYGCLDPIEMGDLVFSQLKEAANYQNSLIALEKERRRRYSDILEAYSELAEAKKTVDDLLEALDKDRQEIKALSSKTRKKLDRRFAVDGLKKKLKAAKEQYKIVKKEVALLATPQIKLLDKEIKDREKQERKNTPVYWGTYQLAELAVDAARKTSSINWKRWRGEGSLSVQLQGGLSVADLFSGKSNFVQIAPIASTAYSQPRSIRKKLTRTTLRIRIGSTGANKTPVWACFPVIIHRPLPANAIIQRATVSRNLVADRAEWRLLLSVKESSFSSIEEPDISKAIVAIDIGWRHVEGQHSIRSGFAVTSKDEYQEIGVTQDIIDKIDHSDGLKSIRDKMFDDAKILVQARLKQRSPVWLQEATTHIHSWRAPRRLVNLIKLWATQPEADELILSWLSYWRARDRHLWQYERSNTKKAYRARREHYRIFASELAKTHNILVLEKDFKSDKLLDISDFGEKHLPEESEKHSTNFRRTKSLAATSELRKIMINAFHRNGGTVLLCQPDSKHCSWCGHLNKWDKETAKGQILTCQSCMQEWDRDFNAGRLMVRTAMRGECVPLPLESSKPSRSKRFLESKKNKKAA